MELKKLDLYGGLSLVSFDFDKYISNLSQIPMTSNDFSYLKNFLSHVNQEWNLTKKAKSIKIDPKILPESEIAWDMGERVEKLIRLPGISDFIYNNMFKYSREKLALKTLDAIIDGHFGKFTLEKTANIAVRTALAILTEAVTIASKKGISQVQIRHFPNHSPYLSIFFAGPIRAAGGTESGLILVYADYIRKRLGLNKYQILQNNQENEINRFIEELRINEREGNKFQFKVTDLQVKTVLKNIPIEINGESDTKQEVMINRDLTRIKTNRLRGGALRVINDGLIGKAPKLSRLISDLNIEGWNWLQEIQDLKKKDIKKGNPIHEVIAGRPIFSDPDKKGGFRLRYGRSHITGLSAVGIHPAIFPLLNYFLVPGTQIKIDSPGKAAIVLPVNNLSPPIIKLKNGSVVLVKSENIAQNLVKDLDKILWLGDILISLGDFQENNQKLKASSYVEEWWIQDLKQELNRKKTQSYPNSIQINSDRMSQILNGVSPTFEESLSLSNFFQIPLYPKFLHRWMNIEVSDIINLLLSVPSLNNSSQDQIILPQDDIIKNILESILMPFTITKKSIIISGNEAKLLKFFSSCKKKLNVKDSHIKENPLDFLYFYTGIKFYDIIGTTIGVRMGRPEKAYKRDMKPPSHGLFPVGNYGGTIRDIFKIIKQNSIISVETINRICKNCDKNCLGIYCDICKTETQQQFYCKKCNIKTLTIKCPQCNIESSLSIKKPVPLEKLINEAIQICGFQPNLLKGVSNLFNSKKIPEKIEKALLRSKHDLSIYKDGTIRFDITNAPITAFKPSDISLTKNQAKLLGYSISSESDLAPIKIQDIIIPEVAAAHLFKVSRFLDDLLQKIYNLPAYYNLKSQKDLIGKFIVGLSPHTSVGVIGRIIGFTKTQVLFAHPMWQAAKRRDCDGDADSIMLLLDCLLNFSKEFLPSSMGGEMDAPMFLTPIIIPLETDSQVHNIELCDVYPQKFYTSTLTESNLDEVSSLVPWLKNRIHTKHQYAPINETFSGSELSITQSQSTYTSLKTMEDKIHAQLTLSKQINAVDDKIVVNSIIQNHLTPDLQGNLRAFNTQTFRCKKCNRIHRRPPLTNKCDVCNGHLINTVHQKSVIKYLNLIKKLLNQYSDDIYLNERISILEKQINLTFNSHIQEKNLLNYM